MGSPLHEFVMNFLAVRERRCNPIARGTTRPLSCRMLMLHYGFVATKNQREDQKNLLKHVCKAKNIHNDVAHNTPPTKTKEITK